MRAAEKNESNVKMEKGKGMKDASCHLNSSARGFQRNLEELQAAGMNSSAKVSHYLLPRTAFCCGTIQEEFYIQIFTV